MNRMLLFIAGSLVVGACAKSPESIAPAYVSPLQYQDLSCTQLAQETERVGSALAIASQQQSDALTNDTVGVIFLGLPVSTLSGGNVAGQVAQLKGERETLRRLSIERQCDTYAAANSID